MHGPSLLSRRPSPARSRAHATRPAPPPPPAPSLPSKRRRRSQESTPCSSGTPASSSSSSSSLSATSMSMLRRRRIHESMPSEKAAFAAFAADLAARFAARSAHTKSEEQRLSVEKKKSLAHGSCARSGMQQWRTRLTQMRMMHFAGGMFVRTRARAPFSLLFPVPGGDRSFAVQYFNLMQARCCPLSHRGHCVAGESSKCTHLLGRVRSRLFTYALNLLLSNRQARERVLRA
mmetsp:Transcript_82902/g.165493  ORF Transcript_82902/g.165493 Transcript_82902/m.165493 type:complete len:233 (-) Transcript_82902:180-878(-)